MWSNSKSLVLNCNIVSPWPPLWLSSNVFNQNPVNDARDTVSFAGPANGMSTGLLNVVDLASGITKEDEGSSLSG